ncbi:MAG: hypothetical protein IJQ18_05780 [Paludibacteraceae bacterium]|nr:hypothetical protein [Paludibacteraceae bacterium]
MKKLLLFALVGMSIFTYSQDVRVNINNQDAVLKDDCAYRINGICSSEDIGGVNVDIQFADEVTWAVFTNYNEFPVTILYEIGRSDNCGKYPSDYNYRPILFYTINGTTGNIVLGMNGSKKVKLDQSVYIFSENKHINDNSHCYSIKGLIVRKLTK